MEFVSILFDILLGLGSVILLAIAIINGFCFAFFFPVIKRSWLSLGIAVLIETTLLLAAVLSFRSI